MVPVRCWPLQAAPYVMALAPCYAKAQHPPVQLFNSILEVSNIAHKLACGAHGSDICTALLSSHLSPVAKR